MVEKAWNRGMMRRACLNLALVLTTVSLGRTVAGAAQSETPSILSRVQRETDPELSELVRIAVMNRQNASDQERFEIVRKVTQSYAQIKLLDQQIEQIGEKIEATAGPADMRHELLLARAELESKRTTEIAVLREVMGIVPRFPFEKQRTGDLNAWLNLQVLEQQVVVYDAVKPFQDYWAMRRHDVAGVLPERETLDYLRGRLRDKENLPIRIDINYRAETRSAGERLRDAVLTLARETGTDMDVEVCLEPINYVSSTMDAPFFCREGRIRTSYGFPVQPPDGRPTLFQKGLVVVDPNDLEQHVLWRLTYPGNLPLRLRVEYDQASVPMARQVAETIRTTAQSLGVADLVAVAQVLVEPVPETAFLGRWEALGKGYFRTMDIRPRGVCQVTMGDGTEKIQAGASVTGTWMPTSRAILVDIGDRSRNQGHFFYLAFINQKGNLVVDRTEVRNQGYFAVHNTGQMIFQKVN